MNKLSRQKTVLITTIYLKEFAGSELNCLSLVKQLSRLGYAVEVATFEFDEPMRSVFLRENINVKVLPEQELAHSHYDLIWAHHAMIFNYIFFEMEISADRIILSSLSSFEPYEQLPVCANACSLCLANSCETRDQLVVEGVSKDHIVVFPNYVEDKWFQNPKKQFPQKPAKIAIVSNHAPKELLQARKLLEQSGCQVVVYGLGHKVVLIEPEVLKRYDLVITIGKTVQFAMAMQIPIFCYDVHGGPGYLTEETLEKAAYLNFSGRGFSHKTAEELANDILSGYAENRNMLPILLEHVKANCVLEQNIRTVLETVLASPVLDCSRIRQQYAGSRRTNQALTRLFFRNREKRQYIAELEEKCRIERDIEAIYNSTSWRVTAPFRKISNWLHNRFPH